MAGYMVFIWDDEAAWAAVGPSTAAANQAAHEDFIARNASALRGGSRLHPSDTATSIRHGADGVPAKPAAWLTLVARRRAMNYFRRNDTLSRKLRLLVNDRHPAAAADVGEDRPAP